MALQSNVNQAPHSGSDVAQGLYILMTLLLANGWTLVSCGTGVGGTRRTSGALSLAEWHTNNNAWQIITRGSIWFTLKRNSANSVDTAFAVVAPATTGDEDTPDSQVTAANQISFASLSISSSTRMHAITFDANDNAAGIRSFYLLFTDGSNVLRGTIVLEAMADGTYAASNPAPYVVTATANGNPFYYSGNNWAWWYSPQSVWASGNYQAVLISFGRLSGDTTVCGVDPWDGEDYGLPVGFGRTTGQGQPGPLGMCAHMKSAAVFRGYPSTINLASDARVYVGSASGCSLLPWPNGTTPL